jgi:hypothetical protein
MPRAAPALGHCEDIGVVGAALHYHVDLDRAEALGRRRLDALDDLGHREIRVIHRLEDGLVERIQAHGDAPQARLLERPCLPREQRAVRGERDLRRQLGEQRHQAVELPAHERLAPGQADFAHAEAHEDAREPRDLLEAEDRAVRKEFVAGVEHLARHAVDAAEIAAVGDRDAQVAHRPGARVGERAARESRGRHALRLEGKDLLLHRC